jgi:hypothetical protein
LLALAGAAAVIVLVGAVMAVLSAGSGGDAKPKAEGTPSGGAGPGSASASPAPSASATSADATPSARPKRTSGSGGSSGGSSDGGAGSAPTAGSGTGGSATGVTFPYRIVSQDQGYFEETVTIVNRSGHEWSSWQLSFTVPGANVRDIWGGLLAQGGSHAIVRSDPLKGVVQPGDSFEVTFGASADTVVAPANCRFNGSPCTFVQ